MTRPTMLDLYCGAGGVAVGYHRAGFDVFGVDTNRATLAAYPFPKVCADALGYLVEHGHRFDVVHASPPCQRFTHGNVAGTQAERHPDLITPTRELLLQLGRPYVIENVPRAPLRDPLVLCGSMFGLRTVDDDGLDLVLRRHRLFESPVALTAPRPCWHLRGEQVAGVYGGARNDKHDARHVRHGGYVPRPEIQAELLGVDWPMSTKALQQAVPPAYTRHIGLQLMAAL